MVTSSQDSVTRVTGCLEQNKIELDEEDPSGPLFFVECAVND